MNFTKDQKVWITKEEYPWTVVECTVSMAFEKGALVSYGVQNFHTYPNEQIFEQEYQARNRAALYCQERIAELQAMKFD